VITIENDILEEVSHEKLIEDFISNNGRRMSDFS
jgi:hypothetical protein